MLTSMKHFTNRHAKMRKFATLVATEVYRKNIAEWSGDRSKKALLDSGKIREVAVAILDVRMGGWGYFLIRVHFMSYSLVLPCAARLGNVG
jgi:hypothetical protein